MSNDPHQPRRDFEPVSPIDNSPDYRDLGLEKDTQVTVRERTSSSSSLGLAIKTPRAARFAEATSVNSPVGPITRSPFAGPPLQTQYLMPQPQPSDVGFGYMSDNQPSKHSSYAGVEVPLTPASPLKSALKPPGTPARFMNPLSPTFKEEEDLEKQELKTDKANAADLKIKTRVRMAKMTLRGVGFSCSLIVVSMLAATFSIFNATRHLPPKATPRGTVHPWDVNQQIWPQITLLAIACISLVMSIAVIYAYWRGGHRRAEKAAAYYTVFAIGFFIFTIVIWAIGAGVLNQTHKNGNGHDMWGWSCKGGTRKDLYKDQVDYDLICRMQSWSLICAIIEIVIEVIVIALYGVVFYRFWTKRKLHKSMDLRDRARSDLYLAQLRSQSAPNTPGFQKTPMSPSFPTHLHDDHTGNGADPVDDGDHATQFAQKHQSFSAPKPFNLQPPPIRVQHATPSLHQESFEPASMAEHVPAAPGEQTYAAVPIPNAYANPLTSPAFQPPPMMHGSSLPGQAITTDGRVESPPGSPRLAHASFR